MSDHTCTDECPECGATWLADADVGVVDKLRAESTAYMSQAWLAELTNRNDTTLEQEKRG